MYDTGLFNELIITIIRGLLIPLVPVVTAYLIALIKKLTEDIHNQLNDIDFIKYSDIAENVVNTAVTAVFQTYIDDILKKRIALTDDEMKLAFNMIKEKSGKIISNTSMSELGKRYTDLDKWLENKIVCCSNQEMKNSINLAVNNEMEAMP